MSRWPEPSLEPAGDQRHRPMETRNKGPSSPSSSHKDATECDPGPSHWQFPLFLVFLVYCLAQALWVNIYLPLLSLSVAVADLASYYLSISVLGFYILCRSSLQTAGALALILARKLCMEVVVPMYQAMWQPWLEVKAWSLSFLRILFRWGWGCTWNLLGNLSQEVSMVVFSWAEGAYSSLVSFSRDKGGALEVILDSILQKLLFISLTSCFNGFWAVFSQCGIVIRGKSSQLLDSARSWWGQHSSMSSMETCASSLSSNGIPLSQRFPGPDPSTLSWCSPGSVSLHSLVVQREAEGGAQGCPWGINSQQPLNSRFQGRGVASSPSGQALAQQVKTACILVILLYIYGATLFIQILK